MSLEISIQHELEILNTELVELNKIRDDIDSKLTELQASDDKMKALFDAITARVTALEKEAEAQPELI